MPKGSGHALREYNLSKPVNRKGRKVHIENFFAFYAFFVVKFFSRSLAPSTSLRACFARDFLFESSSLSNPRPSGEGMGEG